MCDYTQVNYKCGHVRYLVKAWCIRYQQTHERCAPNVVAVENKLDEKCGWLYPFLSSSPRIAPASKTVPFRDRYPKRQGRVHSKPKGKQRPNPRTIHTSTLYPN